MFQYLVSIHYMLLVQTFYVIIKSIVANRFNTLYVVGSTYIKNIFESLMVSIHYMLLVQIKKKIYKRNKSFNTLYVVGSILDSNPLLPIVTKFVSIHYMLLVQNSSFNFLKDLLIFQYIICCCSNKFFINFSIISLFFNTLYVVGSILQISSKFYKNSNSVSIHYMLLVQIIVI